MIHDVSFYAQKMLQLFSSGNIAVVHHFTLEKLSKQPLRKMYAVQGINHIRGVVTHLKSYLQPVFTLKIADMGSKK